MAEKIRIQDYTYNLPEARIAKYPLANRDDSKLLVYTNSVNRQFTASRFTDISKYLPKDALMVFNNTKVVPARLLFKRDTGAVVEIFCLEPDMPSDYQVCFAQTQKCRWKVIVGNIKRWKGGKLSLLNAFEHSDNEDNSLYRMCSEIGLKAELIERSANSAIVEFTWENGMSFSKVMEVCGRIPIPPYLKRDTQPIDYVRYQTYYAKKEGSVAAPTAGLHFTERELNDIDNIGIKRESLCLHVGAGTFLPVKSEFIEDHTMHSEPFSVSKCFLESLLNYAEKPIIAVGTTSTRCLESLYFMGVQCIEKGVPGVVEQWEPYRKEGYDYTLEQSVSALIKYMNDNAIESLISRTRIIIVPGYKYRVVRFLVTNFHQPQSTLLLLIAAFIGESWHSLYDFALANDFRFLSYGDSSLLERI
ncbi:MAG: S-adenosylmethionine:tRNA ribosyltransferase-isomerase [Bacteroidales bacterium]|nr:S-adenosylmethionine:tRNA ribosyltransferase-isomerase [Bacteroidales bacterium]MDD4670904.1 S-adenosylmethionine:tRNA ribosyltransferase-isomerase [Bacteroidales bacterium]